MYDVCSLFTSHDLTQDLLTFDVCVHHSQLADITHDYLEELLKAILFIIYTVY